MNNEQKEIVRKFIYFAQNRLGERMTGQIREMAFRQLQNAYQDLEKEFGDKKDGK